MRDRVVWITGASSGIGASLAVELANRGAMLVLSARRADALNAVRDKLKHPERAAVLPMDVADTDRAPLRVADALRAFGRVDVLVHNAGIGQRALAEDSSLSVDRRIMEVNYFGPVALTKAALPELLSRGDGQLVVVSSVAGYVGTPERSAYCASKHALHGFFESLRAEVAPRGVAITMVCPGFVDTEIAAKALAGDGSPHGRRAGVGISPDRAARDISRGITQRAPEVWTGGPELAAIMLRRWAPGILRTLLPRIPTT